MGLTQSCGGMSEVGWEQQAKSAFWSVWLGFSMLLKSTYVWLLRLLLLIFDSWVVRTQLRDSIKLKTSYLSITCSETIRLNWMVQYSYYFLKSKGVCGSSSLDHPGSESQKTAQDSGSSERVFEQAHSCAVHNSR